MFYNNTLHTYAIYKKLCKEIQVEYRNVIFDRRMNKNINAAAANCSFRYNL